MASEEVLSQFKARSEEADQKILLIKERLQVVKNAHAQKYIQSEKERLTKENAQLALEVEKLKNDLIRVETALGIKQVPLPSQSNISASSIQGQPSDAPKVSQPSEEQKKEQQPKAAKKAEKKNKPKGGNQAPAASDLPMDVSRLDMRVGQIVAVKKHPDADTLYVEEVNLGEETNRTVVSGLVNHVTLEQMQDRKAIFMCNLKPAKMRGVLSQGMIMCASTPEKVEIIELPSTAEIGDRVVVEGYDGKPDAQLNSKKKVWEQVQPDLKINSDGAPTYKGTLWNIQGKGTCIVPSLRDCPIK